MTRKHEVPAETVESYLARGGKVKVLPPAPMPYPQMSPRDVAAADRAYHFSIKGDHHG